MKNWKINWDLFCVFVVFLFVEENKRERWKREYKVSYKFLFSFYKPRAKVPGRKQTKWSILCMFYCYEMVDCETDIGGKMVDCETR